MDGWGYGKALIGAVTDGVRDLVKPEFEEEEEEEVGSDAGSDDADAGLVNHVDPADPVKQPVDFVKPIGEKKPVREPAENLVKPAALVGSADNTMSVNKRQYELMKEEVRKGRKVRQEADEKILHFTQQCEESTHRASELQEKLQLLQKNAAAQEQSLRAEMSTVQTAHTTEMSTLTATIQQLEKKLANPQPTPQPDADPSEAASLHATIAQLRKSLEAVPELKAEIAVLKTADEDRARLKEEAKEAHNLRLKVTALQACESEVELLKDEVKDLTTELAELQEAHGELEAEKDRLQGAVSSRGEEDCDHQHEAKRELEKLTNELKTANEKNDKLQQQIVDLKATSDKASDELSELRAQAPGESTLLDEYRQQIDGLTAQVAELPALRTEMEDLRQASVDAALMRDEIDSLKSSAVTASASQGEVTQLKEQLAEQLRATQAVEQQLTGKAAAVRAAEEKLSNALSEKAELKEKESAVASLEGQLKEKEELLAAQQPAADDTDAGAELRNEVSGLREQIKVIEAARASEKQGYEGNLEKYHEWHRSSQKTLDEATSTSEQRKAQLEQQYQQLQEYHNKIVSQSETIKMLEEEQSKLRAKYQTKDQDLQSTRNLLLKANEEIEDLRSCEENAKATEGETNIIIAKLTGQLKDVTSQLHAERVRSEELAMSEDTRLDEREKTISELFDKVRSAEGHAASVEADAYAKVEELEQKLMTRHEEVKTLTQRLCGLKTDEEARDTEMHGLTQKLANLQSVLDHFVAERDKDIEKATARLLSDLEKAHTATREAEETLAGKNAEIEELRKASHKELATRNSSITTLQNKLAQMRKLLDEAMYKTNEEIMIEKKVVTKLILQYVQAIRNRADLKDILCIMSSALGWSEEEKQLAGCAPQENNGSWWGKLTPQKSGSGPSLSDMWVNFLLAETDGGAPAPKEDVTLCSEMNSVHHEQQSSTPPSTPQSQVNKLAE